MLRFLLSAWLFSFCVYAAVDKSVSRRALNEFNDGAAVLLDVRENDEVSNGRVSGAITFPNSRRGTPEWERFIASLHQDKKIYVYCRSGRRSEDVVAELKKRGFKAENAGGLNELKSEGAETQ